MEPVTQAATEAVPGYFLWKPDRSPVAVHLSFDVIGRLHTSIMRGYGAIPKRGAEVGGVLLGTIAEGIVRIDDFEPVPCGWGRGPSYLLNESEAAAFKEVCQRWHPG